MPTKGLDAETPSQLVKVRYRPYTKGMIITIQKRISAGPANIKNCLALYDIVFLSILLSYTL